MANLIHLYQRHVPWVLFLVTLWWLSLFSIAIADNGAVGNYPWDARSAEAAGRFLTLQSIFESKNSTADQAAGKKTVLGENFVRNLVIGPVGSALGGTSNQSLRYKQSQMMSRNMARMQDLRFKQSQLMSRNMARMQDLRFKQSQLMSRNMARMRNLSYKQSQMMSRNMARMQDLRFKQSQTMPNVQIVRHNRLLKRNLSYKDMQITRAYDRREAFTSVKNVAVSAYNIPSALNPIRVATKTYSLARDVQTLLHTKPGIEKIITSWKRSSQLGKTIFNNNAYKISHYGAKGTSLVRNLWKASKGQSLDRLRYSYTADFKSKQYKSSITRNINYRSPFNQTTITQIRTKSIQ